MGQTNFEKANSNEIKTFTAKPRKKIILLVLTRCGYINSSINTS